MCSELINLFQVEGDVEGENCEWFILGFMKEEEFMESLQRQVIWQMGM